MKDNRNVAVVEKERKWKFDGANGGGTTLEMWWWRKANRDLKIQQCVGNENNRFNKQQNNFAHASRIILYIFLPYLHDHDVKIPNSRT